MTEKVDIFVGLQYRDNLSVGDNRLRLGHRAFHWSIIVANGQYHRFDVTDGIIRDPVTLADINPDRIWVYRHNLSDALHQIPRYLGSIQISNKSIDIPVNQLAAIFESVPMPDSKGDRAQNNCVTWTAQAIRALQKAGYCQDFDLNNFQEFAVTHADRRLADYKNKADPVKYPPGGSRWLRLF